MLALDNAIFDRLTGSVDLMALTANYLNGKAVFTVTPIPEGVVPPFIVVPEPLVDIAGPLETKNTTGRQWVRDIACYTKATGDSTVVETMAELIRSLFHRRAGALTVTGFAPMIASVSGPVRAPSDASIYGRILTVTLTAIGAD